MDTHAFADAFELVDPTVDPCADTLPIAPQWVPIASTAADQIGRGAPPADVARCDLFDQPKPDTVGWFVAYTDDEAVGLWVDMVPDGDGGTCFGWWWADAPDRAWEEAETQWEHRWVVVDLDVLREHFGIEADGIDGVREALAALVHA